MLEAPEAAEDARVAEPTALFERITENEYMCTVEN
jgi:hypothetical protein